MKKQFVNLLCLLLGIALGIGGCLLASFLRDGSPSRKGEGAVEVASAESAVLRNEDLMRLASGVADCLAREEYDTLAEYVHPVYGLVFSPYSTVNLGSNQCFTPQRVAVADKDKTVYVWGVKYGSNEPIQLTARQFFTEVLYDRDYARAPVMGFNTVLRSGNALENVASSFPDAQFVDLYFPPSSGEGTDWRILRMVFEDYEGSMKLSALIHSEYTE